MEYTDDFFLNLIMDFDKRDDTIYPQWALWCANSGDRYYIDGEDGHFYTHERSDEEIAEKHAEDEFNKRKMQYIIDMLEDEEPDLGYEAYVEEALRSGQEVLRYTEWKVKK